MINRKFLILIVLVAIVSLAFFFSSLSLKERKVSVVKEKNNQDIALAKLEGHVQQLKDMVSVVGEHNLSLQQSFSEEKAKALEVREKAVELQEKIKEIAGQKESLANELAKREQELVALKGRSPDDLKSLTEQLSAANQDRGVLQQKVADLAATVESLKKSGPASQGELKKLEQDLQETSNREAKLRVEKQEALQQAQEGKENLAQLNKKNQELERDMNGLKVKLERLTKDYSSLKDEHDTTQLAIKQSEAELAKRTEEITYLKERLDDAESKAFEVYSKYKEMKKETALLREQSVNIQLEKEGLRDELTAAKQKLSELQNKFQQIGSVIKTEGQGNDKNIDVELLPQIHNEQNK